MPTATPFAAAQNFVVPVEAAAQPGPASPVNNAVGGHSSFAAIQQSSVADSATANWGRAGHSVMQSPRLDYAVGPQTASNDDHTRGLRLPDPSDAAATMPPSQLGEITSGVDPGQSERPSLWWESELTKAFFEDRPPIELSLSEAMSRALTEAPELQVLHSDWYIQQKETDRLAAAFDWTTFVESIWNRDSTPVGSDLDGAARRLRRRGLNSAAGVRRLLTDGAQFELSQSAATLNSNSQFINPNNQANTRLSLQYERPLLRGSGASYNTSRIRIAALSTGGAWDRFRAGIQDHLYDVSSSYWTLVLRRGRYLQVRRSWQRAIEIRNEMEARTQIDVTPTMLDRAKAEAATRHADMVESQHDILRAQDSLLRLIYGARFTDFAHSEIIPATLPTTALDDEADTSASIETAIRQRSEVHQAIREIKAAGIQNEVAASELLPVLDMVLTGYVAGLRGNNDIGGSFLNQFSEGEPGVGIGFNYEIPYRNRAAQAAAEQSLIAIKRMQSAFQMTVADVAEDVRNQIIQRRKYQNILEDHYDSLLRARNILHQTSVRRELLTDGTAVADLYLENLLQMQGRLERAEYRYLESQVRYALADNALSRALSELDDMAHTPSLDSRNAATVEFAFPADSMTSSTSGHSLELMLPADTSGSETLYVQPHHSH